MKCKEYIFKLTSGQLAQATTSQQWAARAHRLICQHCRNFTQNDAVLTRVIAQHKAGNTPGKP